MKSKYDQPVKRGKLSLIKSSSQVSEIASLKAQLKGLTKEAQEKQNQMLNLSTRLRQQGLKNQKLKKEVVEEDERVQAFVKKQINYFSQKYKDNKNSPLFFNDNGLSPFELLQIGDQKYEDYEQGNICMVCYTDLEKNAKILCLPCAHIVHKECGIQHFLYNRNCPVCDADLKNA